MHLSVEEEGAGVDAAAPLAGAGEGGAGGAAAHRPSPEHLHPQEPGHGGGEPGQGEDPPGGAQPGGGRVMPVLVSDSWRREGVTQLCRCSCL